MRAININELIFNDDNLIGAGHYGIVKKCVYNGKTYAYKELHNPKEILTPVNIFKFENLNKLPKELINCSEYLVNSDNESTGYLSEFIGEKVIGSYFGGNLETIKNQLKLARESLEKIHNLGVIHCDIHSSNIINSTFIDLDNLKQTNDSMGHLAGDYVLKTLGSILLNYGEKCNIARVGGDEFLAYMPEIDQDEAVSIIKNIISDLEEAKKGSEYLKYSTLSIGMNMCSGKELYANAVRKADKALYHIKHGGKAGYCLFSEIDGIRTRRHLLILRIWLIV